MDHDGHPVFISRTITSITAEYPSLFIPDICHRPPEFGMPGKRETKTVQKTNMRKGSNTIQERLLLNRRGYKLTEQRHWVLTLLKSERKHWNALDLHNALRHRNKHVSLATIYRTLDLLVKLNLARKVSVANRPSVFESNGCKVEKRKHFHLVCRECGRVIDVQPARLSALLEMEKAIRKQYHFNMTNIQITFSGSCADCREQ